MSKHFSYLLIFGESNENNVAYHCNSIPTDVSNTLFNVNHMVESSDSLCLKTNISTTATTLAITRASLQSALRFKNVYIKI